MNWIKKALSEPDGTPSSQRLMVFMLLIFTLDLLACGFYTTGGLPVVPESLSGMIQWLFTALIGGISAGRITGMVQTIKAPPQDQNPSM